MRTRNLQCLFYLKSSHFQKWSLAFFPLYFFFSKSDPSMDFYFILFFASFKYSKEYLEIAHSYAWIAFMSSFNIIVSILLFAIQTAIVKMLPSLSLYLLLKRGPGIFSWKKSCLVLRLSINLISNISTVVHFGLNPPAVMLTASANFFFF